MTVYYLYLLPLSLFAYKSFELDKRNINLFKIVYFFFLILLIGLRDGLHGDNWTYLDKFRNFTTDDLSFLQRKNIGFDLLYITSKTIYNSIFFLNLLIITFNILILNYFLRVFNINNFFLINLVIFFEFVMLLNMGYLKQSIGLSFLFLALISIKNKNVFLFTLWMFVGLSFHKSLIFLVIFIPCFLDEKKSKFMIPIIIFIVLGFVVLYYEEIIRLYYFYLGEGVYFQSRGAGLRIILNIPYFLFFIYLAIYQIVNSNDNRYLYIYLFFYIFIMFLLILNFTTFADRLNLYIIPFKILIISIVLDTFKNSKYLEFIKNMLILKSILIFCMWTAYSEYATKWEYSFFPLTCRSCQ